MRIPTGPGGVRTAEAFFLAPTMQSTRKGTADGERTALACSILCHLLLVAALMAYTPGKRQEPVMMELTVESGAPASTGGGAGGAGFTHSRPAPEVPTQRPAIPSAPPTTAPVERAPGGAGAPVIGRAPRTAPPAKSPPTPTAAAATTTSASAAATGSMANGSAETASAAATGTSATVSAAAGVGPAPTVSALSGTAGHQRGQTAAGGDGPARGGNGGRGPRESTDALRTRYLKQHFAYIRDRIARYQIYPRHAQRMGWSGRVIASFVVLEDGSVGDLSVQTRSGVALLDADALDTIRRAAPFPPPPVRARLSIHLDYALK